MSGAVSAQYAVGCRVCGAEPFEPCRTLKTRRVTDTHQDRIWRQHVTAKEAAMTYRVVYEPHGGFARARDFASRYEAEQYLARAKQHDPSAEIVALAPDATEGEPT